MKRLCRCVLLVPLIAVTAHAQSVEGAWAGMLKVGSGESQLVLHVREDPQGSQRGDFRQAKAGAIATETVFLTRTVTVGKNTYDYFVYLPEGFDPKKAYPVLLFLHGLRLTAEDNDKQPSRGLRLEITRNPKQFDSFIAVFPKAGVNKFWVGEMVEQAVKALDQTVAEFKADPRRLCLMGASMGGYGAFYTAAKHPGKFAALVAISGGILPPGAGNSRRSCGPLCRPTCSSYTTRKTPTARLPRLSGKLQRGSFTAAKTKQFL
jgi:pimeloyl-ACP methyl ester carboxylesterase